MSEEEDNVAQGLTIITAATTEQVRAAADAICEQLASEGARVARILPDARQATLVAQRLADSHKQFLGTDVTTLARWASGRWDTFGDGRHLMDAATRRAFVLKALSQTDCAVLNTRALGTAALIERAISTGAGVEGFEATPADLPEGLPASQADVLAVCQTYLGLARSHGLVEPGQVMASLPGLMGNAGWSHLVLDGISELTPSGLDLVCAAALHDGVTLVVRSKPMGQDAESRPALAKSLGLVHMLVERAQASGIAIQLHDLADDASPANGERPRNPELSALLQALFHPSSQPLSATGAVRFALPSGRYAQAQAICDEIRGLVDRGVAPRDIIVTCKDPLTMASELAGRLGVAGVECRASGSVPTWRTDAGRAMIGLATLLRAEREDGVGLTPAPQLRPCASDLARNPLLAITTSDALALDVAWRGNRLAGASTFLDDLADASPLAAQAIACARAGSLGQAAAVLIPNAAPGRETADAHLRRTATSSLASCIEAADELGVDAIDQLEWILEGIGTRQSLLTVPTHALAAQRDAAVLSGNPNAVRVMTMGATEGEQARAVIVCDLDAGSYSLADRADAAEGLFDAIGLEAAYRQVDKLRWEFSCAVEAASDELVLVRFLNNEDAHETRPSALLEEVIDCYRADVTSLDDLDKMTGLPKDGTLPLAPQVGEERFAEVASPTGALGALGRAVLPNTPALAIATDPGLRSALARPEQPLSPSSIEAYLRCPARWLVERRVPHDAPDAQFGPLEIGTFCHAVLHDAHLALAREGITRITHDMVEDAATRSLITDITNSCFDRQVALNRDATVQVENRLVAIDNLEAERLQAIRADLVRCVLRDQGLPIDFAPALHEWSFGMGEDQEGSQADPIPFAGALLRGRIDRIDADGAGNALVIDYKGGLGTGYEPPRAKKGHEDEPLDPLPLHSQALIYAAALERSSLGLTPQGVLYVSYAQPIARGFIEYGLAMPVCTDIPETSLVAPAPDGKSGLAALLDYVEAEVAGACERLFSGDVSPNPRFGKDSCASCPVSACTRRVL